MAVRILTLGSIAAFVVLVLGIVDVMSPKLALVLFAVWAFICRAYDVWDRELRPALSRPAYRPQDGEGV